jgi:phosphoglycolate phosphatase
MHYCLFDIDGTLLNSGGAGQAAMEAALREVCKVDRPCEGIAFAGRTDRGITAELFAFYGLVFDDDLRTRFLETYLLRLPEELARRDGLVLPGVPELLTALGERDDVVLGLLTGNFQRGADAKLRHYELHAHFLFGGYGDDHPDRDDVARAALRAASAHHGSDLEPHRVWVIGDTPADVRCGRAIGANVIAVATGHYGRAEIEASRPDHLFDDFTAYETVVALVH